MRTSIRRGWPAIAMTLIVAVAGACDSDFTPPTAVELRGDWSATADGTTRDFHFAASDATHAELSGVHDIYLLSSNGSLVQTGHYSVAVREITGHGTTDALVTEALSGPDTGSTFGNAILDWTGDSLTLSSETAAAGELVFHRQ